MGRKLRILYQDTGSVATITTADNREVDASVLYLLPVDAALVLGYVDSDGAGADALAAEGVLDTLDNLGSGNFITILIKIVGCAVDGLPAGIFHTVCSVLIDRSAAGIIDRSAAGIVDNLVCGRCFQEHQAADYDACGRRFYLLSLCAALAAIVITGVLAGITTVAGIRGGRLLCELRAATGAFSICIRLCVAQRVDLALFLHITICLANQTISTLLGTGRFFGNFFFICMRMRRSHIRATAITLIIVIVVHMIRRRL